MGSPLDWRRVRGAFVTVLREAAQQGDALLTEEELLESVTKLDLGQPCPVIERLDQRQSAKHRKRDRPLSS